MKSLYECSDKYMIRTPLKAGNLTELQVKDYDEFLISICKDGVFREQILIASKPLYDTMHLFLRDPGKLSAKKKRHFFNAIMKYYIRSKTRTTPFGVFSSVGIGGFKKQNQLKLNETAFLKKVRVDFGWIIKVVKRVEKECPSNLSFKLNHASYIKGKRAFLNYSTDGKSDEISIRATAVFDIVYNNCKELISFIELVQIIKCSYPNTSEDRIADYLMELIEKEFLISNLRPPLTVEDQFNYFIEQTEYSRLEVSFINKLKAIRNMIESYSQLSIGEGETEYMNLYNYINSVEESNSPLQIDLELRDREINLDYKLRKDIGGLASLFTRIATPVQKRSTHLEQYKIKYLEKYGSNCEVLLLEMMDSSMGIGAPISYTNPQNEYFEMNQIDPNYTESMKNFFLMKYFKAVKHNVPIVLSEDELKDIQKLEVENQEVPVSLELNFFVKKANDKVALYLSPLVGSVDAGKTFGRFSHISKEFKEIIKEANYKEKELKGNESYSCELSYIPNEIRLGNVTRNISYRDKEISLFSNGIKSEKNTVKIEDVLIGINNNTFYARNKSTGEILDFGANNMLNIFLASNVIRFLLEIPKDGKRDWSLFPWIEIYEGFKYIPEIKYEDIVISTEQWNINRKDLNLLSKYTFEEFKSKFILFRDEFNLPQKIYLVNMDNRLLIDSNDDKTLTVLFEELKKAKEAPIQIMALESGEDVLIDNNERAHATEIVVPLFKKEKEERSFPKFYAEVNNDRIKSPFDEWLFLKLYGKKSREEEIIAFELEQFCSELKQFEGVESFFMRYEDPQPHIRLRFKASKNKLFEVAPRVFSWVDNLRKKHMISDFVISPYEREVERYGGSKLISMAEEVFYADSRVAESIIKSIRLRENSMDKELIGVISVLNYLEQFGLDFNSQLQLLQHYSTDSKYRKEFNKKRELYLRLCDGKNDWEALRDNSEGANLINNLELRSYFVKRYAQLINEMQSQNNLCVNFDAIISSVLHLHCNRLFGTDLDFENKVMTLAAYTLYDQRYHKKERY